MTNFTKRLTEIQSNFVTNFKGNASYNYSKDVKFQEFIQECHLGLPSDFIYNALRDLVNEFISWEIVDESSFEKHRGGLTDSLVDVGTNELIEHFKEFPDYAESAKIDNLAPDSTVLDCITMGQYLHIDELAASLFDYVEKEASNAK